MRVSGLDARRFLLRATLLDSKAPDIGSVIGHLGYIQIDPINVCGRMHDLILRNRVEGYREGGLTRYIHGDAEGPGQHFSKRPAFEHHVPNKGILVAFPLEAWPHLRSRMRARQRETSAWSGRLTPREKRFAIHAMERFSEGRALAPEDFEDESRRSRQGWGTSTLAKATLQKLFSHGKLLIAGRRSNRRLYDLPERVLPPSILELPESSPIDVARWGALTRLRQHRLVALKRSELALVHDWVERVEVEGCPVLHCLRTDLELFDAPARSKAADPLLLAPLDPIIYDRRVTRSLWDFDYTWEVYTPPAKRKRGYYALPILSGLELVGHVDARADRAGGRLEVISRSVRRGHKSAPSVRALADFLGLKYR